jgi:TonB-dependent receptor
LARARYQDLIPRRVVDEDEKTISYGNPDLEPRTAWNLDLMYERYLSRLGFFGAGIFYKKFNAFHTTRVFTEDVGGVPFQASQTVMGDGKATYAGFEVSWQQKLGLISPTFSAFSVFGNYTYTWSEGEINGRNVRLTNSPKHTANLSLLYDSPRFGLSFVVAANYRDALLTGVDTNPLRDQYFKGEFHLDFSASKKLTKQLTIAAALNGLMAQKEQEVLGEPGNSNARLLQFEEYGPYGTVTLQYSLW